MTMMQLYIVSAPKDRQDRRGNIRSSHNSHTMTRDLFFCVRKLRVIISTKRDSFIVINDQIIKKNCCALIPGTVSPLILSITRCRLLSSMHNL